MVRFPSPLGYLGRYPTNRKSNGDSEFMAVAVIEIFHADIYRDGGSRYFCFHADDGNWYEFHVPVKRSDGIVSGYSEPKLYLNSVNERNVVQAFSWEEARQFVAELDFDNDRFRELVVVVSKRGKIDHV